MKNKTLGILLIIPFIIGLLSFVTITVFTRTQLIDIDDISFAYNANEFFKIGISYPLNATQVYPTNRYLKEGNNLIWKIENLSEEGIASIKNNDNNYYLDVVSSGTGKVVCSTENGKVSKYFNATFYDKGYISIVPDYSTSGHSIEKNTKVGEYNLVYQNGGVTSDKEKANIDLTINHVMDGTDYGNSDYIVSDISSNISFDTSNHIVSFTGTGDAYLTLQSNIDSSVTSTFSFSIVKDGVNVNNYDELLECTNCSTNGEIVVLRTSLGSLDDTYVSEVIENEGKSQTIYQNKTKENSNYKLFGHCKNFENKTEETKVNESDVEFSFEDEYYTFESTYHTDFIDQFNQYIDEYNKSNIEKKEKISKFLKVGLRVQKDFYGNGFTINQHNLAYPIHGEIGVSGIREPNKEKDYFFGTLPYIGVGDLSTIPLIETYAQDNIGILMDGDNITLNDLNVKNCDTQNEMYNYNYTGTVIEVNGNNNTIKNCILSNGKNVIRAFSSNNFTLYNSIVQNSAEFLMLLGNNKENKIDSEYKTNKSIELNYKNVSVNKSFAEFYDTISGSNAYSKDNATLDSVIYDILINNNNSQDAKNALETIQEGLDRTDGIINQDESINYDTNIVIDDSYFYNSGVFSIGIETAFNGGYMYNGSPTVIKSLLDLIGGGIAPNNIGGTSYPINLDIKGKTKFYDFKSIDDVLTTSIVQEKFSTFAKSFSSSEQLKDLANMTIDDFFKVKEQLKKDAKDYIYEVEKGGETKQYLNTAVILYGGGKNYSNVNFDNLDDKDSYSSKTTLDMTTSYFSSNYSNKLAGILAKAVLCVTGSNPFYFYSNGIIEDNTTPELFNKHPVEQDLWN